MLTDAGFELLVADVRNANEGLDIANELQVSDPDRDVELCATIEEFKVLVRSIASHCSWYKVGYT